MTVLPMLMVLFGLLGSAWCGVSLTQPVGRQKLKCGNVSLLGGWRGGCHSCEDESDEADDVFGVVDTIAREGEVLEMRLSLTPAMTGSFKVYLCPNLLSASTGNCFQNHSLHLTSLDQGQPDDNSTSSEVDDLSPNLEAEPTEFQVTVETDEVVLGVHLPAGLACHHCRLLVRFLSHNYSLDDLSGTASDVYEAEYRSCADISIRQEERVQEVDEEEFVFLGTTMSNNDMKTSVTPGSTLTPTTQVTMRLSTEFIATMSNTSVSSPTARTMTTSSTTTLIPTTSFIESKPMTADTESYVEFKNVTNDDLTEQFATEAASSTSNYVDTTEVVADIVPILYPVQVDLDLNETSTREVIEITESSDLKEKNDQSESTKSSSYPSRGLKPLILVTEKEFDELAESSAMDDLSFNETDSITPTSVQNSSDLEDALIFRLVKERYPNLVAIANPAKKDDNQGHHPSYTVGWGMFLSLPATIMFFFIIFLIYLKQTGSSNPTTKFAKPVLATSTLGGESKRSTLSHGSSAPALYHTIASNNEDVELGMHGKGRSIDEADGSRGYEVSAAGCVPDVIPSGRSTACGGHSPPPMRQEHQPAVMVCSTGSESALHMASTDDTEDSRPNALFIKNAKKRRSGVLSRRWNSLDWENDEESFFAALASRLSRKQSRPEITEL